jgi:hypothetical protein
MNPGKWAFKRGYGFMYGRLKKDLLDGGEESARGHGKRLLARGSVSLLAWAILIGSMLFFGDLISLQLASGLPDGLAIPLGLCGFILFVVWACFASLTLVAGLFEVATGARFRSINDWFRGLRWFQKLVAFPGLLFAVIFAVLLPLRVISLLAPIVLALATPPLEGPVLGRLAHGSPAVLVAAEPDEKRIWLGPGEMADMGTVVEIVSDDAEPSIRRGYFGENRILHPDQHFDSRRVKFRLTAYSETHSIERYRLRPPSAAGP